MFIDLCYVFVCVCCFVVCIILEFGFDMLVDLRLVLVCWGEFLKLCGEEGEEGEEVGVGERWVMRVLVVRWVLVWMKLFMWVWVVVGVVLIWNILVFGVNSLLKCIVNWLSDVLKIIVILVLWMSFMVLLVLNLLVILRLYCDLGKIFWFRVEEVVRVLVVVVSLFSVVFVFDS